MRILLPLNERLSMGSFSKQNRILIFMWSQLYLTGDRKLDDYKLGQTARSFASGVRMVRECLSLFNVCQTKSQIQVASREAR